VLVFVLLDRPSGVDVLFVALGLVLALAVIEFVGQEPEPPTHGIATAAGAPGSCRAAFASVAAAVARLGDVVLDGVISSVAGRPAGSTSPPCRTDSTPAAPACTASSIQRWRAYIVWKVDTEEGAEMPYHVTGTDSFHVIEGEAELETPDAEKIPLVAGASTRSRTGSPPPGGPARRS
jgi:hypothetical protein